MIFRDKLDKKSQKDDLDLLISRVDDTIATKNDINNLSSRFMNYTRTQDFNKEIDRISSFIESVPLDYNSKIESAQINEQLVDRVKLEIKTDNDEMVKETLSKLAQLKLGIDSNSSKLKTHKQQLRDSKSSIMQINQILE